MTRIYQKAKNNPKTKCQSQLQKTKVCLAFYGSIGGARGGRNPDSQAFKAS